MRHQLWMALVFALLIPAAEVPAAETVTLTADEAREAIAALDELKVKTKELDELHLEYGNLLDDYKLVVTANQQLADWNLGLKIAVGIETVIALILIIILWVLRGALK